MFRKRSQAATAVVACLILTVVAEAQECVCGGPNAGLPCTTDEQCAGTWCSNCIVDEAWLGQTAPFAACDNCRLCGAAWLDEFAEYCGVLNGGIVESRSLLSIRLRTGTNFSFMEASTSAAISLPFLITDPTRPVGDPIATNLCTAGVGLVRLDGRVTNQSSWNLGYQYRIIVDGLDSGTGSIQAAKGCSCYNNSWSTCGQPECATCRDNSDCSGGYSVFSSSVCTPLTVPANQPFVLELGVLNGTGVLAAQINRAQVSNGDDGIPNNDPNQAWMDTEVSAWFADGEVFQGLTGGLGKAAGVTVESPPGCMTDPLVHCVVENNIWTPNEADCFGAAVSAGNPLNVGSLMPQVCRDQLTAADLPVVVEDDPVIDSVVLPNMDCACDNVLARRNATLQNFDLPKIWQVGVDIVVEDNSSLASVNLGGDPPVTPPACCAIARSAEEADAVGWSVSGNLSIKNNGPSSVVTLSNLASVGGQFDVESATTVTDLSGTTIAGSLTFDGLAAQSFAGTIPGDATSITLRRDGAAMGVNIPAGALVSGTPFSITTIVSTGVQGAPVLDELSQPASADLFGGAAYDFGGQTLALTGSLTGALSLEDLPSSDRARVTSALAGGTLRLASKGDGSGDAWHALATCGTGETPACGGCATLEMFDAAGSPTIDPALTSRLVFTTEVCHFSSYAILTLNPLSAGIPAVSGWGVMVLLLLVLTGGTLVLGRAGSLQK